MEINEDLEGIYTAFYRSYDPAIGRWVQVDPMAEKYPGMSPYNGMGNNPILNSDPMGDTIRVTAALRNNLDTYEAYQTFANSAEGKQFAELFGEGGKFGEVLVTFDVSYAMDAGTNGESTAMARDGDGNTVRLHAQEDVDQGLASDGSKTTLNSGESLAVNVDLKAVTAEAGKDSRNMANRALTTLHESQHVEITTRDVSRNGHMNLGDIISMS